VIERIPRSAFIVAFALAPLVLAYLAYSRPWYFTSQTYLGGLILIEFLVAAVWLYRSVFFPVVITSFLLAGVNLHVGTFWTAGRWVFLGVGALVGLLIILKERSYHFGLFDAVAFFAVLSALISAAVSLYPEVTLLKVLSILLLFIYCATGARIAVTGRENRFLAGLLTASELFVGVNAACYAVGIEAMGNPNSLGAVMGVVAAPVLLWGALLGGERLVRRRRWALFAIALYLVFISQARAGIAAAFVSCGLLCLAVRKYKLLVEGSVVIVIIVAASAIFRPAAIPSLASTVVYKGVDQEAGLLASRVSPWRAAVDSIRDHPWFGSGLGTTADGHPHDELGMFASSTTVTSEHGSSYLAIMTGVGVVGVVPFSLLLLLLLGKVLRTTAWMLRSKSVSHPAVPLAMILLGGFVHAAFEDWMFAPGNYLCVVFWSLAFVLCDLAPSSPLPGFAVRWQAAVTRRAAGQFASNP